MNLTISRKILGGYLAMAFLTILVSTYAIFNFQNLNQLTFSILKEDFLIISASRKMMDNLLAQERSEKKFLILKDPSIEQLFWMRSKEFTENIKDLNVVGSPEMKPILRKLNILHSECNTIFRREVALIEKNRFNEASSLSEGAFNEKIEAVATLLRNLKSKAEAGADDRIKRISDRGVKASSMTSILCLISLFGGIILALFITYNISSPLKKLQKATGFIAEGNFDYAIKIRRSDEIGQLANRFRTMAKRLKILEAIRLDASPLTRLPGNVAIEKNIEKRLAEKEVFSICHVDLDNFKPFADKYGYAWGSEVIKDVANILKDALKNLGQKDDFIGHIGGDDFIIISTPERAEKICSKVIYEFDKRIMRFYNDQDRKKGFITGKDRRGIVQKFPLMSISIAMVTNDGSRFESSLEMAETAADLKEYAKTLPGSNYVKQEDMKTE